MVRADEESASPHRHTLQTAGLSAGRVISGRQCGRSPVGRNGRSTPSQVRWGGRRNQVGSGRHDEALPAFFCSAWTLHQTARDRAASPCCDCCDPVHPAPSGRVPETALPASSATLVALSTLSAPWTQQHAQVAVALLGDAPKVPVGVRAEFTRRQADPTEEVACALALTPP